MLRLEVIPARYGDCIWIEYGDRRHPRRVLIDGGAAGVYKRTLKPKLQGLPESGRNFELLVVTHVDYDHIRGIIELALDDGLGFKARDVWFNGFRHIPDKPPELLAGKHGEQLTNLLLRNGASWNQIGFNGEAVVIPKSGPLPRVELGSGYARFVFRALGRLIRTEADFLSIHATMATSGLVKRAHRNGKEIHVWTVNDLQTALSMIEVGVDNIITDKPDYIRNVLRAWNDLSDTEKIALWLRNLIVDVDSELVGEL